MTPFTNKRRLAGRDVLGACAVAAMISLLAACNSVSRSNESVSMELESSHDQVYVGERVTVWASTTNTLGRDAEIEWSTSGGELEEIRNGTAAQVTFDEPGTYQVSAKMDLENGIDRMDRVSVRVVQLP